MNADKVWNDLSKAVAKQRWNQAVELSTQLVTSLARGGRPPTITGNMDFDRMVARLMFLAVAGSEQSCMKDAA